MDTSLAILPGVPSGYAPATGGAAAAAGRASAIPSTAEGQAVAPVGADLSGGNYGRLRARQDDLNELALAIRAEGRDVELRKLFPPYPPEQEESMAYLDQIGGLRRQIEALMYPAAPNGASAAQPEASATLAGDISQESQRLLAGLLSRQSISSNRPLLEVVAQIDPVQ